MADVMDQRSAGDHLLVAGTELEPTTQQAREHGSLASLATQQRITCLQRGAERSQRRAVRLADCALELLGVQRGAGVVAQGDQQLVVERGEPTGAVGTDDYTVEAIKQ